MLFALPALSFQAFDFSKFARRILLSSEFLITARQQISRLGVLRLTLHGLFENSHRFRCLALLEQYASFERGSLR